MTDLERLAEAEESIRTLAGEKIEAILRGDLAAVPTDDLVEAAVVLMRHQGSEGQ